jgi:ATP-dependent protease ClpP protease subunit
MFLKQAEHFAKLIHTLAAANIDRIESAQKRGAPSVEDLDCIQSVRWSKIPVALEAYEIAMKASGRPFRSHRDLLPDVLKEKGLYVSNVAGRPSLHIYGAIGGSSGGITASDVQAKLATIPDTQAIDVHVHSPGGSFGEGVAIHSQLANRKGHVYGFVDGSAASAGSLVLMSSYKITMARGSEMMIHNATLNADGSYSEQDLARALKLMQNTNDTLVAIYSPRWQGTEKELRDALQAETYFTPAEAIQCGLADYIAEPNRIAAFEAVTRSHRGPGFSIAACDNRHKRLLCQHAEMRLWQMAADDMLNEIGK